MKFIKKAFGLVIALMGVILGCLILAYFTKPGDRIYEIIFHRGPVQFLTLYATALIVTLLCYRSTVYFRDRLKIQRLKEGKHDCLNDDPSLSNHLRNLRKLLANKNSPKVVLACSQDFIQQQKDHINKAYELTNFLMGSLPAFGLLGTVLGLSGAMFTAFSKGQAGPESIKLFVGALGTALDTTVLALVCALSVGMFVWLLNRHEIELIAQEDKFIRHLFSISSTSEAQGIQHSETNSLVLAEDFKKELRSLIIQVVAETTAKFDKSLQDVAGICRNGVQCAVDEILDKQRAYEDTSVKKIAENLNESINRIGSAIVKYNNYAANTMTSGLRDIVESLDKRIPNELVIRYNHTKETEMEMSHVE